MKAFGIDLTALSDGPVDVDLGEDRPAWEEGLSPHLAEIEEKDVGDVPKLPADAPAGPFGRVVRKVQLAIRQPFHLGGDLPIEA
jgi:hypothetical protein